METIVTIAISIAISLTVSIAVKIAIGVKWKIDINEIMLRCEKERSIEFRILSNWWTNNQSNLALNKNGKIILNKNNRTKYKRYKKLLKLYEKGKLQQ